MTQPTEPQEQPQDQAANATAQPTAQWLDIYESDNAKVSILLRDRCVIQLLVVTAETLPISFAVAALNRWNTNPTRHFELDPDQWVKTYWEGTQPRYVTTVVTTFRDLEWTVIDTKPGTTVSIVEVEQRVTRTRVDWSPESELEPEDIGPMCVVENALLNWNTIAGRQFQLDKEAWTQVDCNNGLRFETTVETAFQTVLELYLDTPEPPLQDSLIQTVVSLLSQQLPDYGVDFTCLFGSLRQVEYAPFVRVTRTYIDNGEYFLEPETGWGTLPVYKVPILLTEIEPMLQAFEQNLAAPEATLDDVLALRKVYRAIADEQGINLEAVNAKRGNHLPQAYLQSTPEPPETELTVGVPAPAVVPAVVAAADLWHEP